jgi:U3 small nucleolar RNA-associated protein 14
MKRHRVNKIKSKAYHRILKRKKKREEEKGKEALNDIYDSEDDNEQMKNMTEEEAVRRIKERMNLRHHNTSKWARMAAKHSNGNKSLRDAYHESVLLGHELTTKANNASNGPNDDDDVSDGGNWSDENSSSGKGKSTTKRAAGDIVNALQAVGEDVELDGKYGGLYKMDFMKKAKERQQDRAREEATEILRDIERIEREADVDSSDDERRSKKRSKKRSAEDEQKIAAAKEELKAKMGSSTSLVLNKSSSEANADDNVQEQNPWLVAPATEGRSAETMAGKKSKRVKTDSSNDVLLGNQSWDDDKSPLLFNGTAANNNDSDTVGQPSKKSKKKGKGNNKGKQAEEPDSNAGPTDDTKSEEVVTKKPLAASTATTQSALINAAFAGPDYEDDFGALKEKMVDEELDIVGKKRQIESADKAGWGDWAGPGKVGVSQRVVKKRKHLLKNLEEKAAQQRAGRNDGQLANVILSERRVKTSSKYKIADVPHPFTSREEYERSLQMPLGDEWNASHIVKKNVKPDILTRAGRIIDPITLPKNYKKSTATGDSGAAQRTPNSGSKSAKKKSLNRNAKFF